MGATAEVLGAALHTKANKVGRGGRCHTAGTCRFCEGDSTSLELCGQAALATAQGILQLNLNLAWVHTSCFVFSEARDQKLPNS